LGWRSIGMSKTKESAPETGTVWVQRRSGIWVPHSSDVRSKSWGPYSNHVAAVIPAFDGALVTAGRAFDISFLGQTIEAAGRSSAIDTMLYTSYGVGAHRLVDPAHNLMTGWWGQDLSAWVPHMISDYSTPRSLPVPGSSKIPWLAKAYAGGAFNVRTAVTTPVLSLILTETVTRLLHIHVDHHCGDLTHKLARAHRQSAMIQGAGAAGAAGLLAVNITLGGFLAPAVVVGFGISAMASALSSLLYRLKSRHQKRSGPVATSFSELLAGFYRADHHDGRPPLGGLPAERDFWAFQPIPVKVGTDASFRTAYAWDRKAA
jgi:hypothetical protein